MTAGDRIRYYTDGYGFVGASRANVTVIPGTEQAPFDEVEALRARVRALERRLEDRAPTGMDVVTHQLAEAIDLLADGIVLFDADERLVTCNQKYREIYHPASTDWGPGTSLEQMARDAAIHCVGLEASDAIDAWVQSRLRDHRDLRGWSEQRLNDERWIRVGEFPIPSGGAVGIRTDITDLKRALEATQHSEVRFRSLVEGSLQGVVVHRDWKPLFANQAIADILGYDDAGEILSLPSMGILYAPYEHDRLQQYGRTRHAGGDAPDQYDMDLARKDGTIITVRNFARLVSWDGLPAVQSTMVDVTEQRRAERVLRENEESLKRILNSLPVAVSVKDVNGRYISINRAYEQLYGIVAPIVTSKRPEDVLVESRSETEIRRAHERRVIESGTVMTREQARKAASGSRRNLLIEKTPFLDATGAVIGVCTAITDVTELKLAQRELARHRDHLEDLVSERTRELERTHDELLRAERLATLGQLTATVSHELRNPLGTIRASFDAIRHEAVSSSPRLQRALGRVERNINRCDNIISELLTYAQVRPLKLAWVSLDEWLTSVMHEQSIPEEINLTLRFMTGLETSVDRMRLSQAVSNVIQNAVQAVSDETPDSATGELEVMTEMVGHRACIRVSDNGPGIPERLQEKIFEPLFSTRSFGIGLGLPLARQILEQHGGGLEFESDPDHGTTFVLWLPLAQ